jgi:hypothetical protein
LKSINSGVFVIAYLAICSFCIAPVCCYAEDVFAKLKDFDLLGVPIQTGSMFYFEINVVESNPYDNDSVSHKRYLGRCIHSNWDESRMDYVMENPKLTKIARMHCHACCLKGGEKLVTMNLGGPGAVNNIQAGEPWPMHMIKFDPTKVVIGGCTKLLSTGFETPIVEALESRFRASASNRSFEGNTGFIIGKTKPSCFEFSFSELDGEGTLEKVILYRKYESTGFHSYIVPSSEMTLDQYREWTVARRNLCTWFPIPKIGPMPHIVNAYEYGMYVNQPKREVEAEFRFFGYEFEKEKIPFDQVSKERFTAAAIAKDFDVEYIEKLLRMDIDSTNTTKAKVQAK